MNIFFTRSEFGTFWLRQLAPVNWLLLLPHIILMKLVKQTRYRKKTLENNISNKYNVTNCMFYID